MTDPRHDKHLPVRERLAARGYRVKDLTREDYERFGYQAGHALWVRGIVRESDGEAIAVGSVWDVIEMLDKGEL